MNKNPLVSLKILTYNHENFILDCLEGAISQTYSPLEIVISDDCSLDRTYDILEEFVGNYKGPHKFVINRNKENLGIARNLKKAIDMCSGELIVNQAGDDISLPNRVQVIFDTWNKSNYTICGFFTNAIFINAKGESKGTYFSPNVKYISKLEEFEQTKFNLAHLFEPYVWMLGATSAFERKIYEDFDPIDSRVKQEDGVLSFRSLLMGGLCYIHEPVVKYRRHDGAISNSTNFKGRTKLLTSEYFYFRNQLNDAYSVGVSNIVINKLKFYCRIAFCKRLIFGIPYFGEKLLRVLVCISHKLK